MLCRGVLFSIQRTKYFSCRHRWLWVNKSTFIIVLWFLFTGMRVLVNLPLTLTQLLRFLVINWQLTTNTVTNDPSINSVVSSSFCNEIKILVYLISSHISMWMWGEPCCWYSTLYNQSELFPNASASPFFLTYMYLFPYVWYMWDSEGIKEHYRDALLACTQTSAISEHANKMVHLPIWDKVKLIDHDLHWYTRSLRVKKAIQNYFV